MSFGIAPDQTRELLAKLEREVKVLSSLPTGGETGDVLIRTALERKGEWSPNLVWTSLSNRWNFLALAFMEKGLAVLYNKPAAISEAGEKIYNITAPFSELNATVEGVIFKGLEVFEKNAQVGLICYLSLKPGSKPITLLHEASTAEKSFQFTSKKNSILHSGQGIFLVRTPSGPFREIFGPSSVWIEAGELNVNLESGVPSVRSRVETQGENVRVNGRVKVKPAGKLLGGETIATGFPKPPNPVKVPFYINETIVQPSGLEVTTAGALKYLGPEIPTETLLIFEFAYALT